MSIPAGATKFVLAGTAPGGEIFETGFWALGNAPISDASAVTLAEAVRDEFVADLLPTIKPLTAPDCHWTRVRVYSYVSGGSAADHTGEATITTGVGTGGASNPLQVCMVATLRTASSGRSHRGRMYFPANGAVFSTGHYLDSGTCSDITVALAHFFTDVNGTLDPGNVSVVSFVLGTASTVTTVTMDQKPDIQRRRANRYSGGAISSAAVG